MQRNRSLAILITLLVISLLAVPIFFFEQMLVYYVFLLLLFLGSLVYVVSYQYLVKKEAFDRDPLTGLLTKTSMEFYVKGDLKSANKKHGVVIVEFNNLKDIQNHYGKEAGEVILKQTAKQIDTVLRPNDRLARIGLNEFTIFLYNVQNRQNLETVKDRIKESIDVPITYKDRLIDFSYVLRQALSQGESTFESLQEKAK
ncbi:diguanylate cyclase domain-containing protein [Lacticigenium naphthae]|uniref:diguanylate cyclase domain-containing protein n=1 Tax=Lacticigenium naphthae TaxID=515351 RepID=UPI000414EC3E|nr:diguanylate cyclase [Lacticigenium naphthae]